MSNSNESSFEKLKRRIHSTRIPLGPTGRFVMGVIYFSTPIIFAVSIFEPIQEIAMKNRASWFINSLIMMCRFRSI
jgi:hypothetical protein